MACFQDRGVPLFDFVHAAPVNDRITAQAGISAQKNGNSLGK